MVVFLEYVQLGGDPWANIRTNDTFALGSTLKKMVTYGSEMLKVVSAFVFFSNTMVLFMTVEVLGRGI